MDVLEKNYDEYLEHLFLNSGNVIKVILGISDNRYKVEDCFRVLKTNFEARPVFHRNMKRIIAHFMICYTALLIYRLLENKLNEYGTHFMSSILSRKIFLHERIHPARARRLDKKIQACSFPS